MLGLLMSVVVLAACGGEDEPAPAVPRSAGAAAGDPGPVHVHGLGVNPADGALFIATHSGLYRARKGAGPARRVGDSRQDTMGFAVVGRNHFLGSGHPDLRDRLPPFLGLIESRDAGRSWKPVSLLGKRDFHVLEASGDRVYGFGSDFGTRLEGLLVSDDRGRSWDERDTPEALVSLAIDPEDPDRIVASGEAELYGSANAARDWRPSAGTAGLLAWPAGTALLALAADGTVSRSADGGRSWRAVGALQGEPAAFEAAGASELYAALHDGRIMGSSDGGRSWSVHSDP